MKDLSGLEIKDFFRIFWYRRWYFLIVFATMSIGGTLYSRHQPDVYRSEARISVDTPLSAISRSSFTIKDRQTAIREHLSSRNFLEKMIQQTGSYGWGVSDNFIMERAVVSVRNNIKIDNISDRTFRIAYRATDPAVAQNVTNQFAEELIRVSRRSETDRTTLVDRFVEGRFAEAEEKLKEQSEKIRQFKARNNGSLPEQVPTIQNAIAGLNQQLTNVENALIQAKNNMEFLESQYDEARKQRAEVDILRKESSKPSTVIPKNASQEELDFAQKRDSLDKAKNSLAQALMRYTPNHPEITKLNREIARLELEVEEAWGRIAYIPASETDAEDVTVPGLRQSDVEERRLDSQYILRRKNFEAEVAKRENEREEILRQKSDYERRLRFAPTLEQEQADLYREEALLQKQYESYAAQKLTTGLATAAETASDNEVYRVIDPANYPIYPESPNRKELIIIAFGLGLVLGTTAVFGRELLDTTISSEEEAKKIFNLPILAAIPSAPKKNKKTELRKTA